MSARRRYGKPDEAPGRRGDRLLARGDGLLRRGGRARRDYAIGAGLGSLALLALLARLLLRDGRAGGWLSLLLVAVMLASTLYAWLVVLPAAHAAREALGQSAPAAGAVSTESLAFTRLHRLSSLLNGVSMVAGVLGLVAVGIRR